MGALLSKLMGVLSGQGGAEATRQTLRQAQRERIKVSLEVTSGKRAVLLVTNIEQVRDDDVIISQPTMGGHHHPLAFGEELRLSLVVNGAYHAGLTRCLGRIKIPGGAPPTPPANSAAATANGAAAEQLIFAYRLELPGLMGSDNRRKFPRVQLRFERPIEAQLYAPASSHGPVLGTVTDISMGGACIRAAIPPGRVVVGQAIFMKSLLPDPVGLIDELVDVMRVDREVRTGLFSVGICFRRRINGLEDLIRAAQEYVPQPKK